MKKFNKILVTSMWFAILAISTVNVFASASDTIKIEYKSLYDYQTPETIDLIKITEFLGVGYLKAIIRGNIKGKKFAYTWHKIKDGKDTILSADTSYLPMWSDTLTITFKSLPTDANETKINCDFRRWRSTIYYTIENETNRGHILMETALDEHIHIKNDSVDYYLTTTDVFPIMAYTKGIPVGEYGMNYCGLRDSGVHPKLWFEKFKIKNYIYLEIKFLAEGN